MFVTHPCVRNCVARRICLSPRRYPRLSVSSFEKGRISSTSQHLCRDSFHGNEDHAWHKRHSFQPKTTMPRLPAGRRKGCIIIPSQGHGLRSDAVFRSVRRKVYRSLRMEVMAPLPGGFSSRTGWDFPWNPVYSIVKEREGNIFPLISLTASKKPKNGT